MVNSGSQSELEELLSRYQFGSIYVTYIPINDLTQVLNDSGRVLQLQAKDYNQAAIDTFKTFLSTNPLGPINEGIAFVQLDLVNGKAGFKRISDRDGVIHSIAWSTTDVHGIAKLCNGYFNHYSHFEETRDSIQSSQTPLRDAWEKVSELKEDPFLTNVRVAELLGNFKVLVDNKPRELQDLQSVDAQTYDAIREVTTQYDTYLAKQQQEQPLATLWSKESEIRDHMEQINIVELKIGELLQKETTQLHLKNCATPFERLGFLSGLGTSNTDELFQVNEYLRFTPSKDRINIRTHTQKGLGSIGLKGFGRGFPDKGGKGGPFEQ